MVALRRKDKELKTANESLRKQKLMFAIFSLATLSIAAYYVSGQPSIPNTNKKFNSDVVAKANREMQKILDLKKLHNQRKLELRVEGEKWISKTTDKMRATLETVISAKSSETELAFAQLRMFQSQLNNSEIKTREKIALAAEVDRTIKSIKKIPLIRNLMNGLPSLSVDVNKTLSPWIAGNIFKSSCVPIPSGVPLAKQPTGDTTMSTLKSRITWLIRAIVVVLFLRFRYGISALPNLETST